MKRNFNRDFLREEKRYSSFPVDFPKAETIFFPEKFVYSICPLNTPISSIEVASALTKLKNNRASGPDALPNELP